MAGAILRRLGAGIIVLWLVHLLTFAALRAMPGDPWNDIAGDRALPAAAVERLKKLYGQDQPLIIQYARDLADKVRGDFGYSLKIARGVPVLDLLARATPVSVSVGCGALLIGLFLGLWVGTLAARAARSRERFAQSADQGLRLLSTLGVSTPEFIIGPVLLMIFSLALGWLPSGGVDSTSALLLPMVTLGLPLAAQIARLSRASLLEELGADFVRTARSKGATEGTIVLEHALRPAFAPVLAYLATAAAQVLTGSMVVESLFAIPGLGYFFVAGALQQDWTLVSGAALEYAFLLVIFNLLADLGMIWLDPRTR